MNNLNNRNQKIISILKDFGMQCCRDKEQYFTSFVTETTRDGCLIETTLYFIAKEIAYEYRAICIEMRQENLKIIFFTLATKQSEHYDVYLSDDNLFPLQQKLNEIANLGLFKAALEFLINQTELKREYKHSPIKDKIILGQARVAVLNSGERINVGWIRFEGDEVIYYTGQGLYNIWRPNMTSDEQKQADNYKKLSETELKNLGYLDRRKISEFISIE